MANFFYDNDKECKRVEVEGYSIADRALEGVDFIVDLKTESVTFKNPDDELYIQEFFMDIDKISKAVIEYAKQADVLVCADTGEEVFNEEFYGKDESVQGIPIQLTRSEDIFPEMTNHPENEK